MVSGGGLAAPVVSPVAPTPLPVAAPAPSTEVIRANLAVPKLVLMEGLNAREVPDRVRAFIRDVKDFFGVVIWARTDIGRRLYLSTALEGSAKAWLDQWTLSRGSYTSDELLGALEVRFAPQVRSKAEEVRLKLKAGDYALRLGESIAAYQSRFDALITPVSRFTDEDRIFWFQQGLATNPDLAANCALDLFGQPFQSYSDLTLHALSEERRLTAGKRARSSLRNNSASIQEMDVDVDDNPPVKKAKTGTAPRAAAAARGGVSKRTGAGKGRE